MAPLCFRSRGSEPLAFEGTRYVRDAPLPFATAKLDTFYDSTKFLSTFFNYFTHLLNILFIFKYLHTRNFFIFPWFNR